MLSEAVWFHTPLHVGTTLTRELFPLGLGCALDYRDGTGDGLLVGRSQRIQITNDCNV